MTLRPGITPGALAIVALLLYGFGLSRAPLHPDEVALARQAYFIAQTGHDLDGRLLPLFVHSENEVWFPPLPTYAAAVAALVLPSSPVSVRWPSLVAGIAVILLVYWIGLQIFASALLAALAAILVLLTPAHYLFSRVALDGIVAVPFVVGSIASALSFLSNKTPRHVWLAGVLLGVGCYASTTAPIQMPIYLLLTALAIWMSGQRQSALYSKLALGFLLPLVCLVPWFAWHPESYADTLGRWAIHAAHIRNPLDGLRALVNWGSLTNRATVYWEFLNPAFLFFPAEANSASASTASGPLALPLFILIPIGMARVCRVSTTAVAVILLVGLAVAPLAAATFGENHAFGRSLEMIPFVALLATPGVEALWMSRSWLARLAAAILLVLVPIQFAFFYISS